MEMPLLKFINQGSDYTDNELRDYTIQGIRSGEISIKTVNNEEKIILNKSILKACKQASNNSRDNDKKEKVNALEQDIRLLSLDPTVRRDARERRRSISRGRVFSETEQAGDPSGIAKVSRTTSPPKK